MLNINDGAGVFLKPLESCIKFGNPIIFENADDDLDPTLEPIL